MSNGKFIVIVLKPPTAAEVRACRISLGQEALGRMRRGLACPHCGDIHHPDAKMALQLIEEGYTALHEAAQATREALKAEKAKNR